MRISDWSADVCSSDLMNYEDLGLAWPEGLAHSWSDEMGWPERAKLPDPEDPSDLVLFDRNTGERFTFNSRQELDHFKYQRYIKRYLRTVVAIRSEEHTSELQSLMRISYAVFCLKTKK